MKSEVSGVAGAVRVAQLKMVDLTRAELHGKRLDVTGKSRAITKEGPITTTGLDLHRLFQDHIQGAFVPRSHSKAMHMIVQFPKELVDGNDGDNMLHHAREFGKQIFGEQAIFADRVDRDEKSRHVVDLFVAPLYLKKTKHQAKLAVTMSRHLKAVAEKYGHRPDPRGCGRALQDALLDYLSENMGLERAQRGSAKLIPGPDWKSAEELRLGELEELSATARNLCQETERDRAIAYADRAKAAAAYEETTRAAHEAAETQRAARAHADAVQAQAEQATRSLDADRSALDLDRAAIKQRDASLSAKTAEVDRQHADVDLRWQAIIRAKEAVARDVEAAKSSREEAERDRQASADLLAQVSADRQALSCRRIHDEEQLSLLARASDEDAGLHLRQTDKSFEMNEDAMSVQESEAYHRTWARPVVEMARRLAKALEQVRAAARRLLQREEAVKEREVEVQAGRAAAAAEARGAALDLEVRRAAHYREQEEKLIQIRLREKELRADEARVTRLASDAESNVAHAALAQKKAAKALDTHQNWAKVISILVRQPELFDITNHGVICAEPLAAPIIPAWLSETLERPVPAWVQPIIDSVRLLRDRTEEAGIREREASYAAKRLQVVLERTAPVLTPAQQLAAADVNRILRRFAPEHHHGFEM